MKQITLIILIFFFTSNISKACDITFVNFGDRNDKLIQNPGSLPFADEFGGEKILIPTSFICSENEKVKDTMVEYLFVDNQLVLITLMRAFMNDSAIMDLEMNKYGKYDVLIGK